MKTVKTMESSMPLKWRRLLRGLLCLTLLFTLPCACAAEPESIDVTPVQAYVQQRFAEKMAADGAEAYRIEYSNLYVSPHDPDTYLRVFCMSVYHGCWELRNSSSANSAIRSTAARCSGMPTGFGPTAGRSGWRRRASSSK